MEKKCTHIIYDRSHDIIKVAIGNNDKCYICGEDINDKTYKLAMKINVQKVICDTAPWILNFSDYIMNAE